VARFEYLAFGFEDRFHEKNQPVWWAMVWLTIGSPFLGLFLMGWPGLILGLALNGIFYWLGLYACKEVRRSKETHDVDEPLGPGI
jgi:hypothetical protein